MFICSCLSHGNSQFSLKGTLTVELDWIAAVFSVTSCTLFVTTSKQYMHAYRFNVTNNRDYSHEINSIQERNPCSVQVYHSLRCASMFEWVSDVLVLRKRGKKTTRRHNNSSMKTNFYWRKKKSSSSLERKTNKLIHFNISDGKQNIRKIREK